VPKSSFCIFYFALFRFAWFLLALHDRHRLPRNRWVAQSLHPPYKKGDATPAEPNSWQLAFGLRRSDLFGLQASSDFRRLLDMDLRNRIALYGCYFLGMAGIGFTLPFLPDYLQAEGLSKQQIGIISMLAALVSLLQFPIGLFADRARAAKPLLLVALSILALSTVLLHGLHGVIWLGIAVIFFAENGICRSLVEGLASAEAARLAPPDQVGSALGALRFWKPAGIVLVALAGGAIAWAYGVDAILMPLAAIQFLAIVAALLIREHGNIAVARPSLASVEAVKPTQRPRDHTLWIFIAAMVLFHIANSPGGVYLALFMKEELRASPWLMSYAFVVSMVVWTLVVQPAGRWADRIGRKPLLIIAWSAMTLRLALVAIATEPWQVLVIQVLDGLANGLFSVIAGAWVMDRFADKRRACESQVMVGTSLVLGSAIGPLLAGLIIEPLGFRSMFGVLTAVGLIGTLIVAVRVPETIAARRVGTTIGPLAVEPQVSAQIY
jgi:MFS family permease